jgi:hypothetical protein
MTPNGFRRIALSMPEAVEASHMGHPDFRVGGKVFASLGYPDARWAMVKLNPEQQVKLVDANPEVFAPVAGGWDATAARMCCFRRPTHRRLKMRSRALGRTLLRSHWQSTQRPAEPGPHAALREKTERILARAFSRAYAPQPDNPRYRTR